MFQRDPRSGIFFGGDRVSGQEVRDQNGAVLFYLAVDSSKNASSYRCSIHSECRQKLVRASRPRQNAGRQYWSAYMLKFI